MGREYEFKMTALLCLRCISQKVLDMWIISNADGVGAFDDVVLHMKTGNASTTYMVQLKHKEDSKNIAEKEFIGFKEDFSLQKYFQDIIKLKESICSDSKPAGVVSDLGPFDNIYFVLSTNRSVPDHKFLVKDCDGTVSFLNSNESAGITYKFDVQHTKLANLGSPDYKNVRLLVNQVHGNDIDDKIIQEFGKILATFKIKTIYLKSIAEKFVKYVTDWARGQLGGHYYLTKSDLICKITELLCCEYELDLSSKKYVYTNCTQRAIWDEIVRKKVLTVVDSNEIVVPFLNEYIGSVVRKYCDKSGDNWMYKLSEKARKAFYKTNNSLRIQILKRVGNQGNVTLLDIYKSLWMCNRLPLLLQVNKKKNYKNILRILGLSNNLYSAIVINASSEDLPRKTGTVKCFNGLPDLDPEDREKILKQSVKLQGREGVSLEQLVDETMSKHIKCSDIISILTSNFNIGGELEALPEYFIARSVSRVFLRPLILNEVRNELFVMMINSDQDYISLSKNLNVCKLEDVAANNLDKCNVIAAREFNQGKLESLKLSTDKAIHTLYFHDQDRFEWKYSSGSTVSITGFQTEFDVFEKNIEQEQFKTTKILCAAPGMGKSMLMDYLAQKTPADQWVLRINLNLYQKYYRSDDSKNSATKASKHLEYFYKALCDNSACNSVLARAVFQKLVDRKDVVVLMDGFDEVSVLHREGVCNIAESFHKEGYKMWLTTRPVMKAHLEKQFNTFALFLKPFTAADQKEFLTKYFSTVNQDLVSNSGILDIFVEKLLQATKNNLSDEDAKFTGIPLQSKLLADYFNNDCRICLDKNSVFAFNTNFDLLCLYQNFVDTKIDILCNKHGAAAEETHFMFKEHQSLFALKLVFPLDNLEQLSVFDDLNHYYEGNPDKLQLFQRDGVIMIDQECEVIVVHRTFAEFLAAEWLFRNFNSRDEGKRKACRILLTERFTQNYKFLFNIFDRFVAKNCQLHLDIINRKFDSVAKIISANPGVLTETDSAGRSVLHIIALNGVQFPELFERDRIRFSNEALTFLRRKLFDKDEMLEMMKQIPDNVISPLQKDLFGYSPIDYALTNRSLTVANRLCPQTNVFTINAFINWIYKYDYLSFCAELQYNSLYKALLVYFAYRDLLMHRASTSTTVKDYFLKCTRAINIYNTPNQSFSHFGDDIRDEFQNIRISQLLQTENGYTYAGYSNNSFSNLHYAVIFGSDENVEELLSKREEINKEDIDGNTPLHYAVLHRRLERAKMLLDQGAIVNKQNHEKATPLHFAFLKYDQSIIELLLSTDIDVNLANSKGETALDYAAKNGYKDDLLQLLGKNADMDKRDRCGYTPLHSAVIRRRHDTARALLAHGANVNLADTKGETPLCHAAKKGYCDMAKELINKGANINEQDGNGNTLLYSSLIAKNETMANLLLSCGADINIANRSGETVLFCAVFRGYTKIVAELLRKGANINKQNVDGNTILHLLIKEGQESTAKMIISYGADANVEANNGKTALHYAVCYCDQIVGQFILNGADVNKQDSDGNTPLHLALNPKHCKNSAGTNVIDLLLSNGACINKQNKYGRTALHIACLHNQSVVAKLLLKGADVDKQDTSGDTPLLMAGRNYELTTAELLISNGADVNKQNGAGETLLHWASSNGQIGLINYLISKGANINEANKKGETCLHLPFLNKQYLTIIATLLSNGADASKQNMKGDTPLHLALRSNYKDAAELLISSGADVNKRNVSGETPLEQARGTNSKHIIELLISNGANVNDQDDKGDTILHWAVTMNSLKLLTFIISKGADANIQNDRSNTPIHNAIWNESALKVLVSSFTNFDQPNDKGDTILHLAVERNYLDIVKSLVLKGACVNLRNTEGDTPLCKAINGNHESIVKFLVTSGANVNDQSSGGNTCLHWAIGLAYWDFMKLLLSKGACVNIRNNKGDTPLHEAFWYTDQDLLENLVTNGGNVNDQNPTGETVLHWAVKRRHFEFIASLVSKGADVNLQNQSGKTALHYIAQCYRSDVTALILSKDVVVDIQDSNGETPLHMASKCGDTATINILLNKGADINKQNNEGNSPLLLATINRGVNNVGFLISKGADVNKRNSKNKTALHYLAQYYRGDVTALILSKGAEIDKQDADGETPLHIASKFGDTDTVSILLSNGADTNKQNNGGNTPLHLATMNHNMSIVELLKSNGADVNKKNSIGKVAAHYY